MKNAVKSADAPMTLTAPYTVAAGACAKVGLIVGVAITDVASGSVGEFQVRGTFDLAAVTADVASVGAAAYWDDTAKLVTGTVGSNTKIGVFAKAKGNGDTTARVRLNGNF